MKVVIKLERVEAEEDNWIRKKKVTALEEKMNIGGAKRECSMDIDMERENQGL